MRPGRLFTSGPGTYKIPTANDVPIDFRVSLLKGAANPRAVFSSKAVGEPPFLLAMSAFFAAKEAVEAARADAGVTGWCAACAGRWACPAPLGGGALLRFIPPRVQSKAVSMIRFVLARAKVSVPRLTAACAAGRWPSVCPLQVPP